MLHQFSKIFLALFILAGIFSSCDKDKDPAPSNNDTTVVIPPDTTGGGDTTNTPVDTTTTPVEPKPTAITITGSDYEPTRKPNLSIKFATLNKLQIRAFPTHGENQVWDLRTYQVSNPVITIENGLLPVPAGTSLTSATFVTTKQSAFIQDFTYTEFFEVSNEGYYKVGDKVHAGTANLGNGTTLKAPGTEVVLTPKNLIFKFPMNYDDITDNQTVLKENYILTSPAFGLSNAPVERKVSYTVKSEVVGWGKVLLPQGAITDSTEVLLVKNTETDVTNYFLNGSTAPSALLSALNLKEGSKGTVIYYRFISKQFGSVAAFGFDVNSNGNVIFPADGASYTVSRE